MAIGDVIAPHDGIPSLTDQEIIALYNQYLGRGPDSGELASERDNAMKYAAAGIERQIANRAGNVAGSGVRGDEGLAPLTQPYIAPAAPNVPLYVPQGQVGNVITMGPAAASPSPMPMGPTGTIYPAYGSPFPPGGVFGAQGLGIGGLSMSTLLLIAALAGAAYYLLYVRR